MKSSKLILLLQGGTSGLGETRGDRWALLGTAGHICANFATCSREPLTMLNPHFVAGEHGCLGPMSLKTFGLFFSRILVLLEKFFTLY